MTKGAVHVLMQSPLLDFSRDEQCQRCNQQWPKLHFLKSFHLLSLTFNIRASQKGWIKLGRKCYMGVFQNIDIVIDIVVCMTVTCKPKYPVTGNFLPGNALHSCLSLIWWESPVNWEIQKTNNPNTEQCHCGGNLLYQDNIAAKTGIFGKHLWQILAVLNKSGVNHQLFFFFFSGWRKNQVVGCC